MTTQSKITSIAILGLAILSVAILYFLEITNTYALPTRGGIQATIQVAVPASLVDWVEQAAEEFSDRHGQIDVKVVPLESGEAEDHLGTSANNLSDVWIAEADFVRANAGSIPFDQHGMSVAHDSLLWVAPSRESNAANNLNWQVVHDSAVNDLQYRVAIPAAGGTDSLAACMSAAATFHQQANVGRGMVNDAAFQAWLEDLLEAVPNRNRNPRDLLGSRPPQADVGLLRKSEWQSLNHENFVHSPPVYDVAFNYPYLIRTRWPKLSESDANAHRLAAERFRDFLLDPTQQNRLRDFGLESAGVTQANKFVQIEQSALSNLRGCWQ